MGAAVRLALICVIAVFAGTGTYTLLQYRYVDTDGDGYYNWQDENPTEWDVGDRDLAIFAGLSYIDGQEYVGSFYPSRRINEEFSVLGMDFEEEEPGIMKKWEIVDYTCQEVSGAIFCATSYKNGDNLVIAYRGTDDGGEWLWNLVGLGIFDFHAEEPVAKEYALSMADRYPECNIYITGHSLGGYLAQFGAAALIGAHRDNLRKVVYFNGMGLGDVLGNKSKKEEERSFLREFAKSHSLVGYQVYGDVVFRIGEHSGEISSIYADDRILDAYKDMERGSGSGWRAGAEQIAIFAFDSAFDNVVSEYYDHYGAKSLIGYLNITHRAENFIGELTQGYRGKPDKMYNGFSE